MNREEASYIIATGKDAIKKLSSISGGHGKRLKKWVENWEFIEAFAAGKFVGYDGSQIDSPWFDSDPERYEILETKINWKKVVENDGLHVRLVVDGAVCRLIGVSKSGSPIVQSEEGRGFFEARISVFFHDEVVPKPEWYELAEGE